MTEQYVWWEKLFIVDFLAFIIYLTNFKIYDRKLYSSWGGVRQVFVFLGLCNFFCCSTVSDHWEKSARRHIASPVSSSFNTSILLSAGASDTADTLFQEVLGRKDKADSTRNALNVLQRFKFLFNLPLNIERNIQKVPATAVASGQFAAAYDMRDQLILFYNFVDCRFILKI